MTKTFPAVTVLLGLIVASSALAQGCEDQRRWPWSDRKAITAALRSEYMQLHASYEAMSCTGRPSVLTGAERYCGTVADRLVAIHHELERNHWLGKRVTACGPEGTRPPLALEPVDEEIPAASDAPAKASGSRVAKSYNTATQAKAVAPQPDKAPVEVAAPAARPSDARDSRRASVKTASASQEAGPISAEAPAPTGALNSQAAPAVQPKRRPAPKTRNADVASQPGPAQVQAAASQQQFQAGDHETPELTAPAPPKLLRAKRPLAPAKASAPDAAPAEPPVTSTSTTLPVLPQSTPRLSTARPLLAARADHPAPSTPTKASAPPTSFVPPARPREAVAAAASPEATLALVSQFAAEPESAAAIGAGYYATVSNAGLYTAAEPPIEPAGSPARKRFMAKGGRFACVRSCDGFYFPLNQSVRGGDAQDMCTSLCPGARTEVYRVPQGGRMADAVSVKGQRYADLRSAFLYRRKVNAGCGCKVQGQSWEALLRPAERVLASPHRDPILDEATADRLSRAQLRAKLRAEAAQEAASREPAAQQAAGGAPPIAPQRQPNRPTPAAQRLEEPRQEHEPAETGSIRSHRRR
ncbi:DUF2865 domain-containing protein [Alsobacter metallidurans]|nr:DUF2865 domain-containing protein [Alsobacter metallidurans]